VVSGVAIERLTKMTDFAQEDAGRRYQRVLEASGITAELERLGIQPGDIVEIAGTEMTWGEPAEIEALEATRSGDFS
jgi:GTP-binding protein